jgi:anion-transporting  ArsA/GET3 family ATPase
MVKKAASPRAGSSSQSTLGAALSGTQVLVICGSGGVGKTTAAAALGAAAVAAGRGKVLVLTIDPAKRLATALGVESFGNTVTEVAPNFSVAMLDTSASWDDLVRRHAPDDTTRDRILVNPLYRNITQRFVQSHDYIALERLHELVTEGLFDFIVIDTPPSRHALDFLDAPQRMAEFFSSTLLRWITFPYRLGGERVGRLGYLAAKPFYQIADRLLGSKFLQDIAEFFLLFQTMYDGFVTRATAVTDLLHRPTTAFVVVTTADPSPLREAEFLLAELATRRLVCKGVVMNRLSPLVATDPQGPGPLLTESAALAARLLAETATATSKSEAPKSETAKSDDQTTRILRSLASTHLSQVEYAQQQRVDWQSLSGVGTAVRVSVSEQTEAVDHLEALTELGKQMWGPDNRGAAW